MSAECPRCGHDLPYEGDCQLCALRAERDEARGAARAEADDADRLRAERDAAEKRANENGEAYLRLRAELERTEEARVAYEKERDWLDGKLTEAWAERDRYREALERIAGSRLLIHAEIAKLARAALEGSEDE